MSTMNAYTSGLRDIATAYIGHREQGVHSHSAFTAALNTYQRRHPEIPRRKAALFVCQLIEDLPQFITSYH